MGLQNENTKKNDEHSKSPSNSGAAQNLNTNKQPSQKQDDTKKDEHHLQTGNSEKDLDPSKSKDNTPMSEAKDQNQKNRSPSQGEDSKPGGSAPFKLNNNQKH